MRADLSSWLCYWFAEDFSLIRFVCLGVCTFWAYFGLSFAIFTSTWTPILVHWPPNSQSSFALAKLSLYKSDFSLPAEQVGVFTPDAGWQKGEWELWSLEENKVERKQMYQQWCALGKRQESISILVLSGVNLSRTWQINAYAYQPSHPKPTPRWAWALWEEQLQRDQCWSPKN